MRHRQSHIMYIHDLQDFIFGNYGVFTLGLASCSIKRTSSKQTEFVISISAVNPRRVVGSWSGTAVGANALWRNISSANNGSHFPVSLKRASSSFGKNTFVYNMAKEPALLCVTLVDGHLLLLSYGARLWQQPRYTDTEKLTRSLHFE